LRGDLRPSVSPSISGSARIGANPEKLFAAGWSASFESAVGLAARKKRIASPTELSIDAEVDLHAANGAYSLSARLNIASPGIAREIAQELLKEALRLVHTQRPHAGTLMLRSS